MYRFKSKADADLLMMKPVGDQILRILGREPAVQGIIEAAALPQAIRSLEEAIAAAELAKRDARRADADDDSNNGAEAVGLQQRAWPMLEMMRRSLAERADVVWGV
jgi:cyclopropane-fatty-acyl-phospholipid synthase